MFCIDTVENFHTGTDKVMSDLGNRKAVDR